MRSKRNLLIGSSFIAVVAALGVGQSLLEQRAEAQATTGAVMAPKFEVDPMWPKPLPNNWTLAETIGVSVDGEDHVWVLHRGNNILGDQVESAAATDGGRQKTGECCAVAPPVLEFDQTGKLLRSWGGSDGPGYQWPNSNHGLWADHKGNIWIGSNGNGQDGHILKFTQEGKFLLQVGIKQEKGLGPDSLSKTRFYLPAKIMMDAKMNELYVADGYGNKRVVVIDGDTGVFKRFWGAYGNTPDDKASLGRYIPGAKGAPQFRGPVHCAEVTNDGMVYVCDRTEDRVQIFNREGKFIKEFLVQPEATGDGTTWDIAFSRDPAQKYMYVADGRNQRIHIYDRQSLVELTNFGTGGHYPGQFYSIHNVASDAKGNLYVTETYQGRRVQKFTYRGIQPVTKKDQGSPWPTTMAR
jgi:DNA-binding beta-propeller fold protein YncE